MNRPAAVAGSFYPRGEAELRRMIAGMTSSDVPRVKAAAVVAPHAGYVYSGPVAGAVYSSVVLPSTYIILAPAHRPIRPTFALMDDGTWETPLGSIPVESGLAAEILRLCPEARVDPAAHAAEHSLEVHLPFLQAQRSGISIVPINVSYRAGFDELASLGRAIAAAIKEFGPDVLLIASTDMSHYVSAAAARKKDFLAIDRILALDPRGLVEIVRDEDITMCGVLPTAAVLIAAAEVGATKGELVRYATSGDVTGDDREVVGYAGLRIL